MGRLRGCSPAGKLGALTTALAAGGDLLLAALHCFWAGSRVTRGLAGMWTIRQSATARLPTLLLALQHLPVLHAESASVSAAMARHLTGIRIAWEGKMACHPRLFLMSSGV